jgi:Tol biopolymer transport system component
MARIAWISGVIVAMVALGIPAVVHFREAPPPELRLQIATPPTTASLDFALSPDGRYIVFVASRPSSNSTERLYLRALNNTIAQPLADTDGARQPFWSPDSRSIGFFASERLFRTDIAGGPPQQLAAAALPQGGAWNADGTIVFSPNTVSALSRVPAAGGEVTSATHLVSSSSMSRVSQTCPAFTSDRSMGRRRHD